MIAKRADVSERKVEAAPAADGLAHREFVGHMESFDVVSAMQFNLLTFLGLRESHHLLDIGCGSLRAGRLLIPYLMPGRYFGMDPYRHVIEDGIQLECGQDLIDLKSPRFSYDENFTCTAFGTEFDFILAQGVFCSCTQEQIARCLSQVRRCLKEEGIFVASFIPGESDYTGGEIPYPEWVTYTPERIAGLVEESGLRPAVLDWYHPHKLTWMLITHPETEIKVPEIGLLQKLEHERDEYRDSLQRLKNHPYVKAGSSVVSLIERFKLSRRIRRVKKSFYAPST